MDGYRHSPEVGLNYPDTLQALPDRGLPADHVGTR